MFLRTLYGSRMPQPRHPRADEQVSNYWRDDTESARELARLMDELDDDDSHDGCDMKKPILPAVVSEDTTASGRARRSSSHLHPSLLHHALPVSPLESLETLDVHDIDGPRSPAQLSPTGLISIAAADIDEAARAPTPSPSAEINLEFLTTIRRATSDTDPRRILVENFMARMLPNSNSMTYETPPQTSNNEEESPLRFLSLLRRINELRSQQVPSETTDVWDGLPYPQILALPTFKYTPREHVNQLDDSEGEYINNTICAVCYTEYAPEEEVRALPCLHFYHRACIDQWLLHHRICPICKHIVAVY